MSRIPNNGKNSDLKYATDLGQDGHPLLSDPGGDEVHLVQHEEQVLVLLLFSEHNAGLPQTSIMYITGLWIRIRINLSCWIRIQEGKNDLQNIEKSKEFSCFEVPGCSLLRAEGFSCSLCGISKDR
jgi:hypothetical protein